MKSKEELLKYVGRIEQIGGVKEYILTEGKSKGTRAIDIDTGLIRLTVLPDRCMDIANVSYKNIPISWISKVGITSAEYHEKEGLGWLRSFFGGMVTTCGLKNIGKPSGGMGLHGRIANTPAERVSINEGWIDGKYVMSITGKMREAIIFGENLILHRTIKAVWGESKIILEDRVENSGYEPQEYALCYHCNFGYPLVSETARIVGVPEEHSRISKPLEAASEECIALDFEGAIKEVGLENRGLGVYLKYTREILNDFLIWKMPGQGDYVIGLEPRTSSYNGIEEIREKGNNRILSSQQSETCRIEFEVQEYSDEFTEDEGLYHWHSI